MSASDSMRWLRYFLALVLSAVAGLTVAQTPEEAVVARLKGEFQTADGPALAVDRVAVVDDWAVASWRQDSRGGRALLQRAPQGWEIVVCGGDPLTEAASLREMGVPAASSDALARQVKAGEATLEAARRAVFGSFQALIRPSAHGHHAASSKAGVTAQHDAHHEH